MKRTIDFNGDPTRESLKSNGFWKFYLENKEDFDVIIDASCRMFQNLVPMEDMKTEILIHLYRNGFLDRYDPSVGRLNSYLTMIVRGYAKNIAAKERTSLKWAMCPDCNYHVLRYVESCPKCGHIMPKSQNEKAIKPQYEKEAEYFDADQEIKSGVSVLVENADLSEKLPEWHLGADTDTDLDTSDLIEKMRSKLSDRDREYFDRMISGYRGTEIAEFFKCSPQYLNFKYGQFREYFRGIRRAIQEVA